eukprot:SAG22_NODE_8879_length_624_cov_1.043810_1_plen_123_part_10
MSRRNAQRKPASNNASEPACVSQQPTATLLENRSPAMMGRKAGGWAAASGLLLLLPSLVLLVLVLPALLPTHLASAESLEELELESWANKELEDARSGYSSQPNLRRLQTPGPGRPTRPTRPP